MRPLDSHLKIEDLVSQRQKICMSEMEWLSGALLNYDFRGDLGWRFPGPTNKLVPISFLRPFIVPKCVDDIILKDCWGENYLYWSNQNQFLLISKGHDKRLDRSYIEVIDDIERDKKTDFAGSSQNPDHDIILLNGRFEQWFSAADAIHKKSE